MDWRRSTTEGAQRRTTEATTEQCPEAKGRRPGADRLSALPDDLLLHILSFLETREAQTTSRLSRRWRYLYHHLSSLDFREGEFWEPLPAWFIDRVLLLHAAPVVERLRICIRVVGDGEDRSLSFRQIDSWLLFAVRRGVRVLDLRIYREPYDGILLYGVPPWVFHCRTLERLSVTDCDLRRTPSHVRLVSLKKMVFIRAELGCDGLKCLLRGCPLLESLQLVHCNEETDLVVDARESRNLEELVIIDTICELSRRDDTELRIHAPSVKYLRFISGPIRRRYAVMDLSSVAVASFQLGICRSLYGDEVDVFTTDFMLRLQHVQVLELCSESLQALFMRELRGGSLVSALPGVKRLDLTMELQEPADLQPIISALHACSKVSILVLTVQLHKEFGNIYSNETESPRRFALDHSGIVMQDLKTIVIQSPRRYCYRVAEFVACEKKKNCIVGLIGFLLRVSPVLEELTVRPSGEWELLSPSDLLSLPRAASPNAQVIMDGK